MPNDQWPTQQNGGMASLNPNQADGPGVTWHMVPVWDPVPWLRFASDNSIAYITRDYTQTISDQTANAEQIMPFRFDRDTTVIGITGAAVKTDGAALAVGRASLDTFAIRVETTAGDTLIRTSTLGSAVVGTGAWPRKISFGAWRFQAATTLQVYVTPLLTVMRVDIVLQVIECFAGQNFTVPGKA